jgi:cytochrome c-type biogenesis protein CcmH
MIFGWMFLLALLLMTPLAFAFLGRGSARNRREAALTLHRAQLDELARDRAEARIGEPEYQAAKLEVERRLLAADGFTEPRLDGNARMLLVATLVAVPIMAFALYLPGSTWNVPSEPHDQWVAKYDAANAELLGDITALRMRLATEDPNTVDASQGEAYLGMLLTKQAGGVTPEALSYFRQSLTNAPPGASWRGLDEQAIAMAQTASQ